LRTGKWRTVQEGKISWRTILEQVHVAAHPPFRFNTPQEVVMNNQDERQLSFFREMEALYRDAVISGQATYDARFMHQMFCVAGLPLREPATRTFSRSTGLMGLNIAPGSITLPDGQELEIGIPYGPKARLIVLSAISEARSPLRQEGDRWIEIGRIETWLKDIGVLRGSRSGQVMTMAKDQLIRLSLAQFSTTYRLPGRRVLLSNDRIMDAGAFDEEELRLYAKNDVPNEDRRSNLSRVRWPEAIRMSEKAFKMFRADDAVPIPSSRLTQVSHSALAIDLFLFLCYTLPGIPQGDPQLVRWKDLINWFGNKRDAPSKFKETFLPALSLAMKAYPEANISADDMTDEGLLLHYSDPAALRQAFMSVQSLPGPVREQKRRRRKIDVDDAA
jgi:hypothetical protein